MARESICGSNMIGDRLNVIKHKVAFLADAAANPEGFSDGGAVGMHWILCEIGQELDDVMALEDAEREARKAREA